MSTPFKKTLAVGLALPALGSAPAHGQDAEPNWRKGIVAGLTLSGESSLTNLVSVLAYGYSYSYITPNALMGPSLGMSFRKQRLNPDRSTLIEVNYTQFGSRFGPISVVKHHIAVPILTQHDYRKHKPITPHIQYGMQSSFRLATTARSRLTFYGGYIANYWNGYGVMRQPLDLGVVGGFGVGFPIQNTRMNLDLRIYQGLVPKASPLGIVLNRQISITSGMTF